MVFHFVQWGKIMGAYALKNAGLWFLFTGQVAVDAIASKGAALQFFTGSIVRSLTCVGEVNWFGFLVVIDGNGAADEKTGKCEHETFPLVAGAVFDFKGIRVAIEACVGFAKYLYVMR